jgi:hypothetical protein
MASKGGDGCVDGGGSSSGDSGSVDNGRWAVHKQNLLSPGVFLYCIVPLTSGALETLGGKKII